MQEIGRFADRNWAHVSDFGKEPLSELLMFRSLVPILEPSPIGFNTDASTNGHAVLEGHVPPVDVKSPGRVNGRWRFRQVENGDYFDVCRAAVSTMLLSWVKRGSVGCVRMAPPSATWTQEMLKGRTADGGRREFFRCASFCMRLVSARACAASLKMPPAPFSVDMSVMMLCVPRSTCRPSRRWDREVEDMPRSLVPFELLSRDGRSHRGVGPTLGVARAR